MCIATLSNNSISNQPLQQSEIKQEEKKATAATTTMISCNYDEGSSSLDESLLDDSITWMQAGVKTYMDTSSQGDGSSSSSAFLVRALNSLASLPGRMTDDSMKMFDNDADEDDQQESAATPTEAEEENSEESQLPPQQQEGGSNNIITRIISRQPITSLDGTASKCVLRCLEDNMEKQSILYKWATSNMTPTVTYMGRKFQPTYDADNNDNDNDHEVTLPSRLKESHNNIPRASSTASSSSGTAATTKTTTTTTLEEQNNMSFVARMGLSWSSGSTHTSSETDDMEAERRQEYKDYMREICNDEMDFSKFKAALKREGVKTNLCLDLLYKVAKKTSRCSSSSSSPQPDEYEPLQQQRRGRCDTGNWSMISGSSSMDEESLLCGTKSRWTRRPHHQDHWHDDDHHAVNAAPGERIVGYAEDDKDAPSSMIIISRCA